MAQFEYSGRDSSGALVEGILDAGNAEEVAARLSIDSVTPIEINRLRKQARSAARERPASPRSGMDGDAGTLANVAAFFSKTRVSLDDLIMFSRQMYSLTKAGLPLDRAIKGLQASVSNKYLEQILGDVVDGLENGMTLASALGRHPKVFSQLFLSLVHVGENTGRLDLAFKEVSNYLNLEKETRKQVKSATRYPMFVMAAMVVAVAVVTVFVIPVFSGAFERLGAELPWQTVVLINTSDFVINYWPLLLIIIVGAVFGTLSYISTERGRLRWDQRKLTLPLAGTVFERVALGRFARTFAMVMRAGLPIVQGLTVVAGAVGNAWIARKVHGMREGVERGESLYRTAMNSDMFSPLVLQMISVGEETGAIDDLLYEVADFYEAEVEYDLKQMSDAIEPILIVFIAGLVLILALGVFLPIWDLNTAVQG